LIAPMVVGRSLAWAIGLVAAMTPASAQPPSEGTKVVILGTGTPNADPERSGPGVAIVVNGHAYLVDAGPGIVRRAAAAARTGIGALAASKLDIVFVTHLHSDHTLGLPDLMLSAWTLERTAPLRVFGPPGIKAMTDNLSSAYREDVRNRLDGAEPANTTGYRVVPKEIVRGGVVYRDSNVTVRAFAVPHGDWKHAFGYRFETRDRTIVISGDTRSSDSVVTACNGCDVMVHEVYSAEHLGVRPPEWQRYHSGAHTSTTQLAQLATRARPKLLVLYHQLYWGATDDDLLRQITAAGYRGRVVSAKDLDVY
jgi:ribonuclease BN (tRNA processing enzyme)